VCCMPQGMRRIFFAESSDKALRKKDKYNMGI
jgi:hypothetical protein